MQAVPDVAGSGPVKSSLTHSAAESRKIMKTRQIRGARKVLIRPIAGIAGLSQYSM
jgi:thiamine monophosphate synthase